MHHNQKLSKARRISHFTFNVYLNGYLKSHTTIEAISNYRKGQNNVRE